HHELRAQDRVANAHRRVEAMRDPKPRARRSWTHARRKNEAPVRNERVVDLREKAHLVALFDVTERARARDDIELFAIGHGEDVVLDELDARASRPTARSPRGFVEHPARKIDADDPLFAQ